jgi:luciferase family oxidoreductase group 1
MSDSVFNGLKYSVLDLATVCQGDSLKDTFARSLQTARFAEAQGYNRYWFSEHHNMESVASAATSVLIGYVAGGTNTIRVGSGGIMLPNHSPLIIAEQFGTLGSLYPDRIDLGLGRAPGTDGLTAMTIRNSPLNIPYDFQKNIEQLQVYFSKDNAHAKVRALPGEGVDVPIWVLGSSTDSAYLAAQMGLPYAFAAHFAPTHMMQAFAIYKEYFRPSDVLDKPYAMACVNIIAADTNEEAAFLATSMYKMFLGIFTNSREPLMPPFDPAGLSDLWTPEQEYGVKHMLSHAFIGDKLTIAKGLKGFVETTGIQEIMTISQIFDQSKKEYSFRLFKEIMTGNI